MKIILFFFLFALFICGCDSTLIKQGNMKRESEKVIKNYFEYIEKEQYEDAASLYSRDFFGNITKDKWEKQLKQIMLKLGTLKSFKLYQAMTLVDKSNKNILYSKFIYEVKHSKFNSIETFILKKEGSKKIKILKYHINSDGLSQEPVAETSKNNK